MALTDLWFSILNLKATKDKFLSHDVVSESDITPCNKICKPLVVYRFTGNVMTSIITLCKIRETLDVFTPKKQFLSILMSYDK